MRQENPVVPILEALIDRPHDFVYHWDKENLIDKKHNITYSVPFNSASNVGVFFPCTYRFGWLNGRRLIKAVKKHQKIKFVKFLKAFEGAE